MERTHFGDFDHPKNRKCTGIKVESKHIKTNISIIEKDPERTVDGATENISDGRLKLKSAQKIGKTMPVVTGQQK